jgi:hypothetical protein
MIGDSCPPRRCPNCQAILTTPATPQNPTAKLQAYTLAGCRRCLTFEMLDLTLRPTLDALLDEDTWNTATNSSPEMKSWVEEIQTTARLRAAAEITADCAAARAWVAAREGGHIADIATLGRFRRSFDPKTGYNIASRPIQDRARWLLDQWRKHSGEWVPPVWGRRKAHLQAPGGKDNGMAANPEEVGT